MKKPTKTILISLAALALVTTIGVSVMKSTGIGSRFQTYLKEKKEEKRLTTKEGQLAYLKEHQQEIKDFVTESNEKIDSVQIDWNKIKWGHEGLILPTEYVYVSGKVNNIPESDWAIIISIEKNGKIDMSEITLVSDVRVKGDLLD